MKNRYGEIELSKRRMKEIIAQMKESDWPHMWVNVNEHGELEPTPFMGRTDIAPSPNLFVLLNVKWMDADAVYYAWWMLIQNRDGYAIHVDM